MAFTEKALTYTLQLEGGDSGRLEGLRSTCSIVMAGQPSQGQASIAIYGMTLERMNKLTTFGTQITNRRNKIKVEAGDKGGAMTLIFTGTILSAAPDGQDPPNLVFRIEALGAKWESEMPSEPTSIKGKTTFSAVMKQLAKKMDGKLFEDNLAKSIPLLNVYLEHNYYEQAKDLAEHRGVEMALERDVLVITDKGNPRKSGGHVKASYKDGTLVAYPSFNESGPIITMYFNPSLRIMDALEVESTITPACGTWYVHHIEYNLAAMMPHGPWFCTAYCSAVKQSEGS